MLTSDMSMYAPDLSKWITVFLISRIMKRSIKNSENNWIGNKKQGGLSQALAVAYRQGISKPNFLQSKQEELYTK